MSMDFSTPKFLQPFLSTPEVKVVKPTEFRSLVPEQPSLSDLQAKLDRAEDEQNGTAWVNADANNTTFGVSVP